MLTVKHAKNPRRTADVDKIDLDVLFREFGTTYIPYTADRNEPAGNGPDLWAQANRGDFGTVVEYVEPMY